MVEVMREAPTSLLPGRELRRPMFAFAALLALVVVAWAGTVASMVGLWWNSATFAHGLVVYPIAAWLVWRERARVATLAASPAPVALLPLAALVAAWGLGRAVDVQVVQQAALVATVPVLVWLCLGWRFVRELWFPLLFTAFAVPFGEALIPWLMEFTASFTVAAVQLTGVPVYRDGMFFSMPRGDFEVAKACSGIRYLIASLALGTLYAYLTYRSWWRRAIFVALSVAVPILANGLRAYGIVMIAHATSMRHAIGVDHLIYGWLFFGVVIFLLFWVGSLFREDDVPVAVPVDVGERAAARVSYPGGAGAAAFAVAALLVLLPPVLLGLGGGADGGATPRAAVPAAAPGWSGPTAPDLDWTPGFRGADAQLRARYAGAAGEVELALVYYATQAEGRELVGAENRLTEGRRWDAISPPTRYSPALAAAPGAATALTVREVRMNGGDGEWLFWSWYVIDGEPLASDLGAKLRQLVQTLAGRRAGGALVAVAAPADEGRDAARATLAAFTAAHLERLLACGGGAVDDAASPCEAAP